MLIQILRVITRGVKPWKARVGVDVCAKFKGPGTVLATAGGAARGAGGCESAAVIGLSEGAPAVCGRSSMLARG